MNLMYVRGVLIAYQENIVDISKISDDCVIILIMFVRSRCFGNNYGYGTQSNSVLGLCV